MIAGAAEETSAVAAVDPRAESDEPSQQARPIAPHGLAYRIFMGYVSLNALAVLVAYYLLPLRQPVREVLGIVDGLNAVILLVDFVARLVTSMHRARYFFLRWGWLDLLGSLPGLPWLRLLRILRSLRQWRSLVRTTPVEIRLAARRQLAESGLFLTATLVLAVVSASSVALAVIEPGAPGATIQSGMDAIWYVFATIATVGYGDEVPVTTVGRAVGIGLMVTGVGAFSVFTSYIASAFIAGRRSGPNGGTVRRE